MLLTLSVVQCHWTDTEEQENRRSLSSGPEQNMSAAGKVGHNPEIRSCYDWTGGRRRCELAWIESVCLEANKRREREMRNDWRGGRGLTERREKRFERKIMICKNKTVRKNKETWRKVWEALSELTDEDVGTVGFIRDVIRRWRCEAVGSLLSSDGVYSHTVWTERIVGKDYGLMSFLKKRQVMSTCWWRRPSFCLFLILFLKQKSPEETKVHTLFPPVEVQILV